MMKTKMLVRTFALAAMASVGAAAQAHADFNSGGSVCGGNSFSTCASVTLSAVVVNNTTVITVTIANTGSEGELFKGIGLTGLPAGTQLSDVTFTTDATGYSAPPPNDLSGGGLTTVTWGASANDQGDMLANGSSTYTFTFTFDGAMDQQQMDALGVGVHAISGPNGCSTKFQYDGNGVLDNTDPELAAQCGSTTVPEPISMTLLATGLAGMSGMGFMRRRKKNELV